MKTVLRGTNAFFDRISIIRSKRKTIGFRVMDDGSLEIRAPLFLSDRAIRDCMMQNADRLKRASEKAAKRKATYDALPAFTDSERKQMERRAKAIIPERVSYYAGLLGVTYGRITIRSQTQRWGSCTSKGNLNFNLLLAVCPPEVLDSVVVHELCHRLEMNHSKRFYDVLYRFFPDYDRADAFLKTEGELLLLRMKKTKELHGCALSQR